MAIALTPEEIIEIIQTASTDLPLAISFVEKMKQVWSSGADVTAQDWADSKAQVLAAHTEVQDS